MPPKGLQTKIVPLSFKFVYKDGAVTDMNGFIFAVGNLDHPAAAVGANPKAANLKQTTIAKLKFNEVGKRHDQRWSS